MARQTRKTVIQMKVEADGYGTGLPDGDSWGATDAIEIVNPQHQIVRDFVPRNLVRPYKGASEHLVGARISRISFDVEFQGSGTKGTAPAWGKLLRCCGMAQTITADTRVVYNPIDASEESGVFAYVVDGVIYTARGCRGNVQVVMNGFEIPLLRFSFLGFDRTRAEGTRTANTTAWKKPVVVNTEMTSALTVGCTLGASGALSSGTRYPTRGAVFDLGNDVQHMKIVEGESIEIVNRESTAKASFALTAAQEVAWANIANAATLDSLGFAHGNPTDPDGQGYRVTVFAPAMQRTLMQPIDYQGQTLMDVDMRLLPSGSSGNNELQIVAW